MLPRLCVYRNCSFARRLKHSVRMEARLISFSAVGAAYLQQRHRQRNFSPVGAASSASFPEYAAPERSLKIY